MAENNRSIKTGGDKAHSIHDYAIVVGSWLAIFTIGMVVFNFGVFFKPVSAQFEWTRAATSGAFSLAQVMSGLAGLAAGLLGDKFSSRMIIVFCGILQVIACLLLSQMSALWHLYLFYGIMVGASMGAIVPITSLLAKSFARQRGLMTGISMTGGAAGSAIGAPIASQLINAHGWSQSYTILALIALGIYAVSAGFLYYSTRGRQASNDKVSTGLGPVATEAEGMSFQEAIVSKPFWILGLVVFCAFFAVQTFQVHVIPHATDIAISSTNAALILTITNAVSVVGSFFAGSINDKIGSTMSLAISMVILVVAAVLLLFAGSLWSFYLVAVAFGLALGGTSTLRPVAVAELFGLRSHGAITGAVLLVASVGGTIGPILTGHIYDVSEQYRLAFLIIVGISLLGLATSLFLKYRRK